MAQQIQVWQNDPATGVLVWADKPDIQAPPFTYTFSLPTYNPSNDITTPDFRYWNAAEALKRGVGFWGNAVATGEWHGGPDLEVRLDAGIKWNAFYDRLALNFFRGSDVPGHFIYGGGSADMLCHEMGHAILDAIQMQLWHTGNAEAEAFHECFGDISAILCALQVPSMRTSILASTYGDIFANSSLSRIAEQFGTALHGLYPDDSDADCLRNAHNHFCYALPASLPPSGPTTSLTSNSHSFSRVFTGALLEALAGMLALHYPPTPNKLRDVTLEMRDIIAEAATYAPLVPQYYASVAAKMIVASANKNPAYALVFGATFVSRLILSLTSVTTILSSQIAAQITGFAQKVVNKTYTPNLGSLPSSSQYGLDRPLVVELPTEVEATIARSATPDGKPMDPLDPLEAAQTYVDELFITGRVNYGVFADKHHKGDTDNKDPDLFHTTHRLELIDDQLRLVRIRIHCAPDLSGNNDIRGGRNVS